jgi:hypothetical protein
MMSALAPRSLQIAWGYWYAKRVLRVTMQEKTLKTTSETISGPYFDMAADTFRCRSPRVPEYRQRDVGRSAARRRIPSGLVETSQDCSGGKSCCTLN